MFAAYVCSLRVTLRGQTKVKHVSGHRGVRPVSFDSNGRLEVKGQGQRQVRHMSLNTRREIVTPVTHESLQSEGPSQSQNQLALIVHTSPIRWRQRVLFIPPNVQHTHTHTDTTVLLNTQIRKISFKGQHLFLQINNGRKLQLRR